LEHAARPFQNDPTLDLAPVPSALRNVVTFVAKSNPPELAAHARARERDDDATFLSRLGVFWSGERAAGDDYLSRALLRPYAEFLRARAIAPQRTLAPGRCHFCNAPPSLSCRRDASASDGAARFLVCSLCGFEWSFDRIVCPSCCEREPTKLPSFSDPARGHATIDACETCHRYLKSIDVSDDPRRLPEIDELESLALDLWANEQGFTRIEPGIAGI